MTDAAIGFGWGVAVLSGYWAVSMALTRIFPKSGTKAQFLAADRELGLWESALSIAATWIWAPALFLASQKAYTQGLAGVFWFTIPNVLCLMVFAYFARLIRKKAPEGFTLSAYMRERFSKRVQGLYLAEMSGLAVCSFAVQLLAGGKVLSWLTGIDFWALTIVLAAIALSYSMWGGLKSSVVTDYMQMLIILVVGGVCLVWAFNEAGGWGVILKGMGGRTGTYGRLFSGDGLGVAFSFGIPVTIGLMAGPFGDQSFWQRAFAAKERYAAKSFVLGALIFAIVPIMMSGLGFIAAGLAWDVKDPALVNLDAVVRLLPAWMVIPFVIMLLSGLISTLDSNLCSISSIMGHDLSGSDENDSRALKRSRLGMVMLALAGVGAANIPGMEILYLFLFYGTLRASTLLPTVISLLWGRAAESGMFWGILTSILLGLPVFAYGNFGGGANWAVTGSLLTVLASGAILTAVTLYKGRGALADDASNSWSGLDRKNSRTG